MVQLMGLLAAFAALAFRGVDESRDEFFQRLAALAATAPQEGPLRGECSLTGRVHTDLGEPLAGVSVRATRRVDRSIRPYADPIVDTGPAPLELGAALKGSADYYMKVLRGQRETTTDAEGRFAFEDLAEGDYDLAAWKRGFEVVLAPEGRRELIRLRTSADADFVATPALAQTFDVRNADGTPAPQAMLQFERLGLGLRPRTALWTPEEPSALLSAGDWYVVAMVHDPERIGFTDPRRAWYCSERRLVTISPRVEPALVTLVLRSVPAIEGEIDLADPGKSPRVIGVQLQPGQEPDPALLADPRLSRETLSRTGPKRAQPDRTSPDRWHYRLDGISPGRWYVGVALDEKRPPIVAEVIEVGDGCVVHDFVLPVDEAHEGILVRVFEPDGSPLRDCEFRFVTAQRQADGRTYRHSSNLYGRREGNCSFRLPTDDFRDTTTLVAVHPRFGAASIDVGVGQRENSIRFVEPAAVTLRMPGFAENATGREVNVVVGPAADADSQRSATTAAATEVLDLGRLQPGAYRIRIESDFDPDDHYAEHEIASTIVRLEAGPREIVLPFPRLEELRVAVPASERATLVLRPEQDPIDGRRGGEWVAEPDADGIAVFRDVPPGSYFVARRSERMLVEAPARETIRFVQGRVRALSVTVTDPEGPLARAGLRTGDRVVAIGGQEFESAEELARLRQSLRRDEITLTIERAGERFEIVIAPALFTGREGGGTFTDSLR